MTPAPPADMAAPMTPPADAPRCRCGYDLRAHAPDATCPECGTPAAQSRQWWAQRRRPTWADSDPRWRRRVLAGVWLLALLPLAEASKAFGWAAAVPAPVLFDMRGAVRTLDHTLLYQFGANGAVYHVLLFGVGVGLLFMPHRPRPGGPRERTRRAGIMCAYPVLLLGLAPVVFLIALVTTGIAALFNSIPVIVQPKGARLLAEVGAALLRYGPHPGEAARVACVGFSCSAVVLACVSLDDALRRVRGGRWGVVLLGPLVLFALAHLAQTAWTTVQAATSGSPYAPLFSGYRGSDLPVLYFRPAVLTDSVEAFHRGVGRWDWLSLALGVEATKAGVVLAVAVWLTAAQVAAWRRARRTRRSVSTPG